MGLSLGPQGWGEVEGVKGGQIGLCDEKRMKSGVLLKRNLERGGTTLPLSFLDVRINHSLKLPIFVGRVTSSI